jgi:hypothetical protein
MGEQRQTIGVMALPELKKALERQAKEEGRSASNLCERLLQWAFEQMVEAGDSNALMNWEARPKRPRSTRISRETQEHLYIALETIVARAPSTVVEEVTRILTSRAGKYGEEKASD